MKYPRKYMHLMPTYDPELGKLVMFAVAKDGSAWVLDENGWTQFDPLPDGEVEVPWAAPLPPPFHGKTIRGHV